MGPEWLGAGAPSLDEILLEGVNISKFDLFINVLFNLDNASHPKLLQNGELRPMLHAALASLIMYYVERAAYGEMHAVRVAMNNAFQSCHMGDGDDPASKFKVWGDTIRLKFQTDNLHMLHRQDNAAGSAQV